MTSIRPTCTVPPYLGGSPCPNHPAPIRILPMPEPPKKD